MDRAFGRVDALLAAAVVIAFVPACQVPAFVYGNRPCDDEADCAAGWSCRDRDADDPLDVPRTCQRYCTEHTDCLGEGTPETEVCDRELHRCVPAEELRYVIEGGTGAGCPASNAETCCGQDAPCGSIAAAVVYPARSPQFVAVGAGTFDSVATFGSDSVVLIGAGTNATFITSGDETLQVRGEASLGVERLAISSTLTGGFAVGCLGDGVSSVGPRVSLRDVVVHDVSVGVFANPCPRLEITRTIIANAGLGLHLVSSSVDVTNTVVRDSYGGVDFYDVVASRFAFNTVLDSARGGGLAIGCYNANELELSSNIVAGPTQGCTWSYSALQDPAFGTNTNDDPGFLDGDFHLAPSSPLRGRADPALAAEIPRDFDGDSRPLGGGAEPGADEIE